MNNGNVGVRWHEVVIVLEWLLMYWSINVMYLSSHVMYLSSHVMYLSSHVM